MNESKTILFSLKNMDVDKVQSFNIPKNVEGRVNGIFLKEDMISNIEIGKRINERNTDEYIFIKLYMGNMQIGSILSSEDYVLELELDKQFPCFEIRKALDYDYEEA